MKQCNQCRYGVPDGALVCGHCGSRFVGATALHRAPLALAGIGAILVAFSWWARDLPVLALEIPIARWIVVHRMDLLVLGVLLMVAAVGAWFTKRRFWPAR